MIELLVSLSLILTGLVGALFVVQSALRLSQAARNELIASQLVAEGIEIARNFRDNNWLNVNFADADDFGCGTVSDNWRGGVLGGAYRSCPGFYEADYNDLFFNEDDPSGMFPVRLAALGVGQEEVAAQNASRLKLGNPGNTGGLSAYLYDTAVTGELTRFRRIIEIREGELTATDPNADTHSVIVRSTVTWNGRGGRLCGYTFDPTLHCLRTEELMYNWF